MSCHRNSPRHPARVQADPGHYYAARRRQRASYIGTDSPAEVGPTLGLAVDPENLLAAYDELRRDGGKAPGPDGLTFQGLGRSEVASCCRRLSWTILAGFYRPGPTLRVEVPKGGGGTRTLAIANLMDRAVAKAVANAVTPVFEATFLGGSHGFRDRRGTWSLLIALEATMAAEGRWVLAVDDVAQAFDNIRIELALAAFAEHLADPSLLALIELILRGGDDDQSRAIGIPQGNPLSPLALNAVLHNTHDLPFAGGRRNPPWHRYVDDLTYACRSVPEGDHALGQVRQLLAQAGLALKGKPGLSLDLSAGEEAQVLGFTLRRDGERLRLGLSTDALDDLALDLEQAHADEDPPGAADSAIRGWIASRGPALEEPGDAINRIARTAACLGFRELTPRRELGERCDHSYLKWLDHRERARRRREEGGDDLAGTAAPPAVIAPGGPI